MADADLMKLVDRVSKLRVPCRETDALIAAALRIGAEHEWAFKYPAWIATKDGRVHLEKNGPSFAAPAFTASIDTALSLVDDHWFWRVGHDGEGADPTAFKATVLPWPSRQQIAVCETAALALCAAALRARLMEGEGEK